MDESEFDKFADEYDSIHTSNIKLSGETPRFFSEYKILDLVKLVNRYHLSKKVKIVDFGSGVGNSIEFIRKYLPTSELTCLDVSRKSLDIAKKRFSNKSEYIHFDGKKIPLNDNGYDIVFSACVFHHIPKNEHDSLLIEIYRILKKGGVFVVFEHNPYNPLTRHAVNTCSFDVNAELITASQFTNKIKNTGFSDIHRSYRIFFPKLFYFFRKIEPFLKWLPLGAQYYVVARKI